MAEREDEIRKRLENAAPAPWPEDYVYNAIRHIVRNCGDFIESETDPAFSWSKYDDSPLIQHAPADLRYLLEKVERLEDLLYGACDSLDLEGCLNDSEDELYRWYHEYLAAQQKEPTDENHS